MCEVRSPAFCKKVEIDHFINERSYKPNVLDMVSIVQVTCTVALKSNVNDLLSSPHNPIVVSYSMVRLTHCNLVSKVFDNGTRTDLTSLEAKNKFIMKPSNKERLSLFIFIEREI
jgi:hypothetical protein